MDHYKGKRITHIDVKRKGFDVSEVSIHFEDGLPLIISPGVNGTLEVYGESPVRFLPLVPDFGRG